MSDGHLKMKTALFAGTFDPYTTGHHRIVQRALSMFDRIVVAVGHNTGKNTMFPIEERLAAISALYGEDERVTVASYDVLTVDFAVSVGATCLLRGVRSVRDFEYERDLADMNMRISNIETVFLISEPEYAAISSSAVRELLLFGKDISAFVPQAKK